MIDILDTKLLIFISKNKLTFALIVLLFGNIYQYVDGKNQKKQDDIQIGILNQQIRDIGKEEVDYERGEKDKLEFLLSNLVRTPDDGKNQKK